MFGADGHVQGGQIGSNTRGTRLRGRKTPRHPSKATCWQFANVGTHPLSVSMCVSLRLTEAEPRSIILGYVAHGANGLAQGRLPPPSRVLLVLPLQQMNSSVRMAAIPCLGLILFLWSQGPGVQGQEFQFGPCRVEGVVLQELWEAFRATKDIVVSDKCCSGPSCSHYCACRLIFYGYGALCSLLIITLWSLRQHKPTDPLTHEETEVQKDGINP